MNDSGTNNININISMSDIGGHGGYTGKEGSRRGKGCFIITVLLILISTGGFFLFQGIIHGFVNQVAWIILEYLPKVEERASEFVMMIEGLLPLISMILFIFLWVTFDKLVVLLHIGGR